MDYKTLNAYFGVLGTPEQYRIAAANNEKAYAFLPTEMKNYIRWAMLLGGDLVYLTTSGEWSTKGSQSLELGCVYRVTKLPRLLGTLTLDDLPGDMREKLTHGVAITQLSRLEISTLDHFHSQGLMQFSGSGPNSYPCWVLPQRNETATHWVHQAEDCQYGFLRLIVKEKEYRTPCDGDAGKEVEVKDHRDCDDAWIKAVFVCVAEYGNDNIGELYITHDGDWVHQGGGYSAWQECRIKK